MYNYTTELLIIVDNFKQYFLLPAILEALGKFQYLTEIVLLVHVQCSYNQCRLPRKTIETPTVQSGKYQRINECNQHIIFAFQS